ncbi:hypothetical protein K488DRAFT_71807 [Vararia minispora EC-137]|uniref:Uncharacterized protein n=1 Tax=Vararia minispora EC-137 TaxID=1314806 RepID=A0ACB8QH06_9AGAM|nr:hypothetical protein K488DRAFT_71807 [Vararia minispora EC-137]
MSRYARLPTFAASATLMPRLRSELPIVPAELSAVPAMCLHILSAGHRDAVCTPAHRFYPPDQRLDVSPAAAAARVAAALGLDAELVITHARMNAELGQGARAVPCIVLAERVRDVGSGEWTTADLAPADTAKLGKFRDILGIEGEPQWHSHGPRPSSAAYTVYPNSHPEFRKLDNSAGAASRGCCFAALAFIPAYFQEQFVPLGGSRPIPNLEIFQARFKFQVFQRLSGFLYLRTSGYIQTWLPRERHTQSSSMKMIDLAALKLTRY